jgi:hypothetical protein
MIILSLILYLCITTKNMNYSIEIKPNRLLAIIAAISITIVSSGLLWLSTKGFIDPTWRKVLFYISLSLYGLCAYGIVKQLRRSKGLLLTQDGFQHFDDFKDLGLVPWSALKHIREEEVGMNKAIALVLDDPDFYMNKLSSMKRRIAKINRMNYDSFYILQSSLYKMKHKELIALFREKHQDFKENNE